MKLKQLQIQAISLFGMIGFLSILVAGVFGKAALAAGQLEGAWSQACRNGVERTEHFSDHIATLWERFYEDAICSSSSIEIRANGLFSIGGLLRSPEGARELDFQFQAVSIRVLNERARRYFTEKKMCGYSQWSTGEWKEITGRICEFSSPSMQVPLAGEWRFGLYRIEKNLLFFGKLSLEYDARTPERRPRVWDPFPYKRVY